VLLNDLISDNHIDLSCLTETWLSHEEYVCLNESTPPSHINTHIPRGTGRGGGVAAIFDSSLFINPKPKLNYNSFKSLVLCLSHPTWKTLQPILFVILYRPPGPYSEFISSLVLKTDKVIIVGDFNIHVDVDNDCLSATFISLLDSIDFCQEITETHSTAFKEAIPSAFDSIPRLNITEDFWSNFSQSQIVSAAVAQ